MAELREADSSTTVLVHEGPRADIQELGRYLTRAVFTGVPLRPIAVGERLYAIPANMGPVSCEVTSVAPLDGGRCKVEVIIHTHPDRLSR